MQPMLGIQCNKATAVMPFRPWCAAIVCNSQTNKQRDKQTITQMNQSINLSIKHSIYINKKKKKTTMGRGGGGDPKKERQTNQSRRKTGKTRERGKRQKGDGGMKERDLVQTFEAFIAGCSKSKCAHFRAGRSAFAREEGNGGKTERRKNIWDGEGGGGGGLDRRKLRKTGGRKTDRDTDGWIGFQTIRRTNSRLIDRQTGRQIYR